MPNIINLKDFETLTAETISQYLEVNRWVKNNKSIIIPFLTKILRNKTNNNWEYYETYIPHSEECQWGGNKEFEIKLEDDQKFIYFINSDISQEFNELIKNLVLAATKVNKEKIIFPGRHGEYGLDTLSDTIKLMQKDNAIFSSNYSNESSKKTPFFLDIIISIAGAFDAYDEINAFLNEKYQASELREKQKQEDEKTFGYVSGIIKETEDLNKWYTETRKQYNK